MKLPSEAELIEMENAALLLPSLAASRARAADHFWDRGKDREFREAAAESAALDLLYPRIQQLIGIMRELSAGSK